MKAGSAGLLVTSAGALALALLPVRVAPATMAHLGIASAPDAKCRVILVARGTYRLTVSTGGGPVPVVEFKKAYGPQFEPIRVTSGRIGDCDATPGPAIVQRSRNATPLLFHVANELYSLARVTWQSNERDATSYPYRDFGNLLIPIEQEMLLAGAREAFASIASDLIRRYANPSSLLTDKGAKWVAETAVSMMMQSYVEGRDPGLVIDGLLTRMVDHLRSHADNLAQQVGGAELKELLRPHLTAIANDVKRLLVEEQPDAQSVTVESTSTDDRCNYFLSLTWSFKGGTYIGMLDIQCGEGPPDQIRTVSVASVAVAPGEAGAVTAQAIATTGSAFPLATGDVNGIAPVQAPGVGEPAAVIAANQATFNFTAATPRHDDEYPFRARVTTIPEVGGFVGEGRGIVTVVNVPPEITELRPGALSARPGEQFDLSGARVVVHDANGDAAGTDEVVTRSIALVHPAGLRTAPLLNRADNPRRISHDVGSGTFVLGFDRSGRLPDVHEHGTWPLAVSVRDDNGLVADGVIPLTVVDVEPVVREVRVTPGFVHRGEGRQIDVTLRVSDANGVTDITGVRVDARAAGGAVYAVGEGLVEVDRGEDWIEYRLAAPFTQTDDLGYHDVLVTVDDEANTGSGKGILHVGNLAPEIGGYGYLSGLDAGATLETSPSHQRGLCPRERFRVGIIASDAEGDRLSVSATIVETGARVELQLSGDKVYIGEMFAPDEPRVYTLRLDVNEIPPDKSSAVTMTLEVVACEKDENQQRVVAGEPLIPADIAAAPLDAGSQLMLGSLQGVTVDPSPAAVSGPSAEAYLDSLTAVVREVVAVNGNVPVESYLVATGGSTGPVIRFLGINRSEVPVEMTGGMLVFEPVAITPAIQSRVSALLQGYLAAGGRSQLIDAYCLELFRKPPAAGTLMRIAAAPTIERFRSAGRILAAVDDLNARGMLNPDGELDGYLHAIRQWSIWTREERLDLARFGDELVRTTRENVEQMGGQWSAEVERAVRGLVPGRWADIQAVLALAAEDNEGRPRTGR